MACDTTSDLSLGCEYMFATGTTTTWVLVTANAAWARISASTMFRAPRWPVRWKRIRDRVRILTDNFIPWSLNSTGRKQLTSSGRKFAIGRWTPALGAAFEAERKRPGSSRMANPVRAEMIDPAMLNSNDPA